MVSKSKIKSLSSLCYGIFYKFWFELYLVKFRAVAKFSAPWRNRALKKEPVTCPKFTCKSLPFVNLCYFLTLQI